MSAAPDDLDLMSGATSPAEVEADAARVARALDRGAVASVVGEINAAVAPRPLRDPAPSDRREAGVFDVPAEPAPVSVSEALPKVVAPAVEQAAGTDATPEASPRVAHETLEIQRPLQAGSRHDTTQQVRIPEIARAAEPTSASTTAPRRWWILGVVGVIGAGAVLLAVVFGRTKSAPTEASSSGRPETSASVPGGPVRTPPTPPVSAVPPVESTPTVNPAASPTPVPHPTSSAVPPRLTPTSAPSFGKYHGEE